VVKEAIHIKVKIVYVMPRLDFGGVESRRLTLGKYFDKKLYDLKFCTIDRFGKIAKEMEGIGIPVRYLKTSQGLLNPVVIWRLCKYFRKEKPSIAHTALMEGNFHGVIAAYLMRVPVIVCEEVGVPIGRSYLIRSINPVISRLADRMIAVSENVKEYLVKKEWVPEGKIVVIQNALDIEWFEKTIDDEGEIPFKFKSSGEIVIGSVGRLSEEKGYENLIRAFKWILDDGIKARLVLVGEGKLKEALINLSYELGLNERVYFAGLRRDVPNLLKMMDIFVLPSKWEGLPIALLEAMYVGLPIIASRVGGIPEVVEDGREGFLINPGDAEELKKALNKLILMDKPLRKKMGERGEEKVLRKFSPEMYVKNLTKLYTCLLQEKGIKV